MDEAVVTDLQRLIEQQTVALPDRAVVDEQLRAFRDRFGPAVLARLEGADLLRRLHGRLDDDDRCLAYWLEFKDDEQFAGALYGGIGGGSALKFGLYQKADGSWVTGSPQRQQRLTEDEAIRLADQQRDELLAGERVIAAFDPRAADDAASERLQQQMQLAAPALSRQSWARKYWFLLGADRLDASHSARWQRFHLLKLLDMPPDGLGVLHVPGAGRFNCVGRFLGLAQRLSLTPVELGRVLNARHGPLRGYWKLGTTEGDTGASHWQEMRDGGFGAIGWTAVGDLRGLMEATDADLRDGIRDRLAGQYADPRMRSRKAGEIFHFVRGMARDDVVVACTGQQVLGVGRVQDAYVFAPGERFPHRRAIRWIDVRAWPLPKIEGPRTSVYPLGREAANVLEIERRLAMPEGPVPSPRASLPAVPGPAGLPPARDLPPDRPLPPVDPAVARIDDVLRRKGQVLIYGPPGTGKTRHALIAARELAARAVHRRSWQDLHEDERRRMEGPDGQVRLQSFHAGWTYEQFIEGLRPGVVNGALVFTPEDGVFKRLCAQARAHPAHPHYLVIDEFNRADVTRVFGELLTALELDKRGIELELPLTRERFSVPRNVHLIGTMNTADRSISLLDAALRRRFGFIELMPDSGTLRGRRAGSLAMGPWLDALNQRLRTHLPRDARNLQVGHAYLLSPTPVDSLDAFAVVLRDEIVPLLEEYCYDDPATLAAILGPDLVDTKNARIRDELFAPSRLLDLERAMSFPEMSAWALDEPAEDEMADVADGDADAEPETESDEPGDAPRA